MLKRDERGFTLSEIMVVVVILSVIAMIAVPAFFRSREISRATGCQENLCKIEDAVEQWASEHNGTEGMAVSWADLVGEKSYLKSIPRCRGGGRYSSEGEDGAFKVGIAPRCSYAIPSWFDTVLGKYSHKIPDSAQ
jgi:type IV pilus assembly protein PilA